MNLLLYTGSAGALEKLAKMGFADSDFVGAITSGEVTHEMLSSRPSLWWQTLGNRCIHSTLAERGAVSLRDLNLQVKKRGPFWTCE